MTPYLPRETVTFPALQKNKVLDAVKTLLQQVKVWSLCDPPKEDADCPKMLRICFPAIAIDSGYSATKERLGVFALDEIVRWNAGASRAIGDLRCGPSLRACTVGPSPKS